MEEPVGWEAATAVQVVDAVPAVAAPVVAAMDLAAAAAAAAGCGVG
jgi:hypothetical protein